MLANASNGLKTLGAIDLLQIARFAKGCIALSEGTEDARDHPRWYVSAPLRGKTPPHDATKWYISAPLRDSLFAASPHRVGSCRLHALWAICSVGDSQKAQREIPVKGVAAKPCAAPLTGVSCCAMKSPPTGNAPEGLSCPQRGRRRKPEGEKLPGSERQRESGGTQGGALRHPPLRSVFRPPTPKKNSPPQRTKTLVP